MRRMAKMMAWIGAACLALAAFLVIDTLATDERRFSVDQMLNDFVTADSEDLEGHNDMEDAQFAVSALQTLKQGVFFTAPLDLRDILPAAPPDWTRSYYLQRDGERIMGRASPTSGIALTTSDELLHNLARSKQSSLGAAFTYAAGEALVVIAIQSELQRFRHLASGNPTFIDPLLPLAADKIEGPTFARLDGLPIFEGPSGLGYRVFTMDLGRIAEVTILANADDEAVAQTLSGFDMAAFQSVLPRRTHDYTPRTGLILHATTDIMAGADTPHPPVPETASH